MPISNKINEINFETNLLTNFNYSALNPKYLTSLNINNNNLELTDIKVFSNLINLKDLGIGVGSFYNGNYIENTRKDIYNRFYGSLESLKNLTRLERLNISSTSINKGLEYLPNSLNFFYQDSELCTAMIIYDNNFSIWKAIHPISMKKVGKDVLEIDYEDFNFSNSTEAPLFLQNEEYKNIQLNSNHLLTSLDYDNFILRGERPFSWDKNFSENKSKVLPTRLYNITKGINKQHVSDRLELNKDVELTRPKENETFPVNPNIQRYVGMSYVCGTLRSDGEIYANARKALNKVIAALELLNKNKSEADKINHVWIDQLSILQDGEEGRIDKGREIPKMRDYYDHSLATLIAIDAEIGDSVDKTNEYVLVKYLLALISQFPWFTRSWCFQEGFLSKQTIFMFDDFIVDGRILAQYWGIMRKKDDYYNNKSIMEFEYDKVSHTRFITPFGWSYSPQQSNDQFNLINRQDKTEELANNWILELLSYDTKMPINLRLGEALYAVGSRSKTVLVDGIYSILGLLPYGDKVPVNYKSNLCKECKNIEQQSLQSVICSHENSLKTEFATYFKSDLENVLKNLIEISLQEESYLSIMSWFGPRDNQLMPIIDGNYNFIIEKIVDKKDFNDLKENIEEINKNFIHLNSAVILFVEDKWKEISKEEKKFLKIKCKDEEGTEILITLYYDDNIIIEKGDILITISARVAIIIPINPQNHIYLLNCHGDWGWNFYEMIINLKDRIIIQEKEGIINYVEKHFDYLLESVKINLINDLKKDPDNEINNKLIDILNSFSDFELEQKSIWWKKLFSFVDENKENESFKFSNSPICYLCNIEIKKNHWFECSECKNNFIGKDLYFNDQEQDILLCSEECQFQWEDSKKESVSSVSEEYTSIIEQLDISRD